MTFTLTGRPLGPDCVTRTRTARGGEPVGSHGWSSLRCAGDSNLQRYQTVTITSRLELGRPLALKIITMISAPVRVRRRRLALGQPIAGAALAGLESARRKNSVTRCSQPPRHWHLPLDRAAGRAAESLIPVPGGDITGGPRKLRGRSSDIHPVTLLARGGPSDWDLSRGRRPSNLNWHVSPSTVMGLPGPGGPGLGLSGAAQTNRCC